MSIRTPWIGALILLLAPTAHATVWEVPSGVSTIAGAVALAAPGDTVRIACGTYFEHDIALTQEITILGATGFADCVTIDAQQQGRVFFSEDATGDAHLEGITVTGGSVAGPDPGSGWGGGILFIGGSPTLLRCHVTGNSATLGGGLVLSAHGSSTVTECEISNNSAVLGGGVACYVTTAALTDCTVFGNSADSTGGGVSATLATVTLTGCTLYGNGAPEGGALAGDLSSSFVVDRSILSFAASGEAAWCDSTSTAALTCCDVVGNPGGDYVGPLAGQSGTGGNFSADPLYCDAGSGDFTLAAASPCLPGQHPDGASCGLVGAHGVGTCGGASGVADLVPADALRLAIHPNPFRLGTEIVYSAPAGTSGELVIHDVHGRRVRALPVAGGAGRVVWDGRDDAGQPVAPGVFFVRLQAGAHEVLRKATRLR